MAEEPLLSSISARGLAQSFIRRGASEGQTGASILGFLREQGLGYRTQNFYEDFRKWKGVEKYETQITDLDQDRLIPEGWTQDTPYKLTSEYLYQLKATYVDIDTGTEILTNWGINSNERMSKQELEDYSVVFQPDSPPEGNVEFDHVDVYQAWRRS